MEAIKYELKYCERCGTLKLRQVASLSTYCRRCEGLLERYALRRAATDANSAALPLPAPALRMLAMIPVVVVSDRLAGRVQ